MYRGPFDLPEDLEKTILTQLDPTFRWDERNVQIALEWARETLIRNTLLELIQECTVMIGIRDGDPVFKMPRIPEA
jgi:hypothetical protein